MKMRTSRKEGFTLVEILIVVGIIGLLAGIMIPNVLKARATSQQEACINNLRQLDAAKHQWALEAGKASTDTPGKTDIQPYLGRSSTGGLPYCPEDATRTFDQSYTLGSMSTVPVCNINGQGQKDVNTPHVMPLPAN